MALLEVFCNAVATFLNHAEEINLWPAVAKLAALHNNEDLLPNRLQMDPDDGISREFMEIKAYGMHARQEFPQAVGLRPENRDKNRYRDIVPFDKSRVIIDNDGYVNASLVEGLMSCCSYIAAQGPLPGQACDFWRMVVRYKCPVVVMLCDLIEAGRSKCTKYWPNEVGQAEEYGSVTVTLLSEERFPVLPPNNRAQMYTPISRLFEITFTDNDGRLQVTKCRQYQMTGWPDHGVPSMAAITSLIDLTALLIHTYPPSSNMDSERSSYICVHCSAGCGRSGVFIGLHQICALLKLRQLDSNMLSSGLLEIVKSMRYQRVAMVQTFEQYIFLYQLVATLLRRVSRCCLRRLVKMGVSLEETEGNRDVFISNSPSPPPPKPPDPFGGSTNNVSWQQQQPLKPSTAVAFGRFFATEIASDIVVAHRTSDWAVLRRSSHLLMESIPRSIRQSSVIPNQKASPKTAQPYMKPATILRRASTVETPSVMRRSIAVPNPAAVSNGGVKSVIQQVASQRVPQKPRLISYEMSATKPPSCAAPGPFPVQQKSNDLSRLEGVEQQLAELVLTVEKLASSPPVASPLSPRTGRRRGMHRRQLSGSYDNLNEVAVLNAESQGNVLSAPLSVDTQPDNSRIVVDLSNLSPPYQNLISPKQEGKDSPQKEQQNPMLASQLTTSPPPPLPPPRRRKKEPLQEHHLSVAHLVLNKQPNETTTQPSSSVVPVESATLGRHSVIGQKFIRNGIAPAMINGASQVQNSLMSNTLPPVANNHHPNIHFNPFFSQRSQTPRPAFRRLMSQLSDSNAVANDTPFGMLGRFRSVAHLGPIPPQPQHLANSSIRHMPLLDKYPASTPVTPSSSVNPPLA